MSRIVWRVIGAFAAMVIVGASAIAVGVALAEKNSQSSAIDASIAATESADQARDDEAMARVHAGTAAAETACENAVRARLKSPTTAQFAVTDDEALGPDDTLKGKVTGTVDSQNPYGATLRSDWECYLLPGSTDSAPQASVTSLVQH